MKYLLIFITFLLLGCGSNSSDNIEDKPNIVIVKNMPRGVCTSSEYKVLLSTIGFNDYIVEEIDQDVNCEDFGKSQDSGNCAIIPYYSTIKDTTNCVIGYTPSNEDISKIPNGK